MYVVAENTLLVFAIAYFILVLYCDITYTLRTSVESDICGGFLQVMNRKNVAMITLS